MKIKNLYTKILKNASEIAYYQNMLLENKVWHVELEAKYEYLKAKYRELQEQIGIEEEIEKFN